MNELRDSNTTHDNHIVPQFYLRQWCDMNNKIQTYDFIHQKYESHYTTEIGYLKDTYSQEIEDMFAHEENDIAKIYPTIIFKLQNAEWKQSLLHKKSVLSEDEEYTLMKFLYLQKMRTITGRVMLSDLIYDAPLSVAEMLHIAEEQNDILKDKLMHLSRESVYQNIQGCYWFIFKAPNHYCFWTTTNPVHYGDFETLYYPMKALSSDNKQFDSILLTLSPTLKLCITYPNNNVVDILTKPHNRNMNFGYKFHTNFLNVMPLNVDYGWKHILGYSEKVMNAMNFAVIQGYEMQASTCQENAKINGEIHPKSSKFYILANKFTKNDDHYLKCFGIKDVYEHI